MREVLAKLRLPLITCAFGGALLVLVVAFTVDRSLGRDLLLIQPHDEATVELNRSLYLEGDAVAEIYGNPLSQPLRVISPDEQYLIVPDEDPSLLLMRVNKSLGQNPLQAQTLWFFAKFLVPALALVGVGALFLPRRKV